MKTTSIAAMLALTTSACVTGELLVEVTDVSDGAAPDTSMVEMKAVTFMMGCNASLDAQCDPDESPYHAVAMATFFIGRTEVTQAAYRDCIDAGVCTTPGTVPAECRWDPDNRGQFPVTCVTHAQAAQYCAWKQGRLPTEAEWERASRGAEGRLYPWGNEPADCTRAQTSECGAELVEVGTLAAGATPDGVYDMAGNAFEWVADWYEAGYYEVTVSENPSGPSNSAVGGRVLRSGSVTYAARYSRVSNRAAQTPEEFRFSVGFRCAR